MATRDKLRRLEKTMRGKLAYFELADGSRFSFEPEKVCQEMFLFFMETLRALHHGEPRPEPPDLLKAVANAKDREQAYRAVFPNGAPFMPLEEEDLVERGELVPRPLVESELAGGV